MDDDYDAGYDEPDFDAEADFFEAEERGDFDEEEIEEEEAAEEVEVEGEVEAEDVLLPAEIEDEKEEQNEILEIEIQKQDRSKEFSSLSNFQILSPDHNSTVSITICPPDERRTSHRLGQAEMTAALIYRATQIEKNPKVFTDVTGLTDPIEMAKKEFRDRKCPLTLRRFISPTYCEEWNVNEMVHPMSNA